MPSRWRLICVILAIFSVTGTQLAVGQAAPPSPPNCENAARTDSATPLKAGRASGTDPGSMGSTGWTGGTGGSNIGTSADGPTKGSNSDQPATAQGLDLEGASGPSAKRQAPSEPKTTC